METLCTHKDISHGVERCSVACSIAISRLSQVLDFVYVRTNIPGPNFPQAQFAEQLSGCSCQDDGCAEHESSCSCVQRYGLTYDSKGHLSTAHTWEDHISPILECNRSCACSDSCCQRVVQHGFKQALEVFCTVQKGFGLRSLEDISANTFICEYAGEVLTTATAKLRYNSAHIDAPNYIMALNEHCSSGEVTQTFIDPTYIGNVGRFINHSCEPNLFMLPVRVDHAIPRLALFSLRPLHAGEELTYDYSGKPHPPGVETPSPGSSIREGDAWSDIVVELRSSGDVSAYARKPCYCGSAVCLGVLPFDPTLSAE